MEQKFEDRMHVDESRGFVMAFHDSPAVKQLDLKALEAHIPGSEYGEFETPDGADCQALFSEEGRVILMTNVHSEMGRATVISEHRPMELSSVLANVPEDQRNIVKDAVKNHLPKQNALSTAWLSCAHEGEQFDASVDVIKTLPRFPSSGKPTFSAKEAFGIMQAEVGVTKHDADRPVLVSKGTGPCIGLSLYNERTKEGLVTHIDDVTDYDHVTACIFAMRENYDDPLVAHLTGGWSSTYPMLAEIVLRLKELPNIEIKGWEEPDNINVDIALDTRTGEVFSDVGSDRVDKGPLVEERENRILASFGGGDPRPLLCTYHYETGRDTALQYTNG